MVINTMHYEQRKFDFLALCKKLLKIAKYCSRFGTVTVFAHKGMFRKKMAASKYEKKNSKK